MEFAAKADIGLIRNTNEDAIALPQSIARSFGADKPLLFCLADGVGGGRAG